MHACITSFVGVKHHSTTEWRREREGWSRLLANTEFRESIYNLDDNEAITLIMSLRTTRQRTITINDNEREMAPMATEDRRSSQTSRTLRARTRHGEETHQQSLFLRIIKYIALCLIALCVCAGAVLSKVSLVSITGRMFYLSKSDPDDDPTPRSVLFIQLTFMLVVPEVVSFVSCLVRGVIGKTTKSFPWPTWRALVCVSQYNIMIIILVA